MSAAEAIARWMDEPVDFVREVFDVEPDAWQVEVLNAIRDRRKLNKRRFALKASKGPGKSALLAWIGWWFLVCFPHPKVVCTSITADNLKDNLWTEFSKWQGRSEFLRRAFQWAAERISAKQHPQTWWASARNWPKDADANRQADTLAGVHGDNVLFLIDESGGIPDAVFAAAEGGLANADEAEGREALLVQAGNPTETSGPLYRACTVERDLWWVKEISGDPDDPNRAPRVSLEWAREQIEKYGRDNPWVLVNVFGRFPPGQSNTLIAIDDAVAATRRTPDKAEFLEEPLAMGVDVAAYGDDRTVFSWRRGAVAFKMEVLRKRDTMEVADQVAFHADRHHPDGIIVDQTGVGEGVVHRLKRMGLEPMGIYGSNAAIRTEPRCLNRRAESWWRMAEWMRTRGSIPNDATLIKELAAPTYKFDSQGRLVLEPKADVKKRLGESPDLADALALTFAVDLVRRRKGDGMPDRGKALTTYDIYREPERPSSRAQTDYDLWR